MKKSQKTGFPRVDAAIKSIALNPETHSLAETPEKAYFYQLRAAQNLGIFEPFTDEQKALNAYLSKCRAGKKLCDYAWRLYAQSL